VRLWDGAALELAEPDEQGVLEREPLASWSVAPAPGIAAAAQAPDGRRWLLLGAAGALLLVRRGARARDHSGSGTAPPPFRCLRAGGPGLGLAVRGAPAAAHASRRRGGAGGAAGHALPGGR